MEVLERTGLLSFYAQLKQLKLRWRGYLVRMDDEWLSKRVIYGDFVMGSRRQGGQVRHYKDTLKTSLKQLHINPATWEDLARNRSDWRSTIKTGAAIYESNRIATAKTKRVAQKSSVPWTNTGNAQALPNYPRFKHTFRARIGLKLEGLHASDDNATVENRRYQLRNVIQATTLEVLARARLQYKDWFDDNEADISNLLADKNGLHKAYMELRTDATKAARLELHRCSSLTAKHLPRVDMSNDLDLPPYLPENIQAVLQISSRKAPGSDAMPPEVYNHGGPRLMVELTSLFQEMWHQGQVPQDFKFATIVHLYKQKGNRQLYDNHRGISFLKIARKTFARILLSCLNGHLEQGLLPESQCGFRLHRAKTELIFAAHQLQDECQEMRTYLYTTFVDLTKAFDTVNRDGLWNVMQKFGSCVTENGTVSEAFTVTNGVKQGCVLALTLFSLMFSATLMDAYHDEHPRIRITYRTDSHLDNSQRMQTPTCVSTATVHDLLFAEDCALNTVTEEDI
ncbi:unnamed protein product [Schistocephalus solidus]|uniref:Reverse transcriptase domain-containing protein n=1 Tax=Schistocephalus solidus TaxID=70667 RepID=A0A183SXE9_SCHSO|nr:unnamed protein product [Schistocephalus solidus]